MSDISNISEQQLQILADNAEDLLRKEKLGNHILGVYVSNNILGITCIYMDSVNSLLDPSLKKHGTKIFNTDYGTITMLELHEFIKNVFISKRSPLSWDCSLDIINEFFKNDIFYEDETIADIMSATYDYINDKNGISANEVGKLVADLYRLLV